jgi:hypothetical protein
LEERNVTKTADLNPQEHDVDGVDSEDNKELAQQIDAQEVHQIEPTPDIREEHHDARPRLELAEWSGQQQLSQLDQERKMKMH